MKKIIFLLMLLISMYAVSADLSMNVPSTVNSEANFDIVIVGSSLYGVQLTIPTGFLIVADSSSGQIASDGIYRTNYASNLRLTLRAPAWHNTEPGIFYIKGTYTEGAGVKTFTDAKIEVKNSITTQISCPECPANTLWSDCTINQQSRIVYTCNEQTNYVCKKDTEMKSCTIVPACNAGWVCSDNMKLGLQREDCSYSTVISCKNGCNFDTNTCNPETTNSITGAITKVNESGGRLWITQIFQGIVNFLKKLFGMA
jgi:hypothetical protein